MTETELEIRSPSDGRLMGAVPIDDAATVARKAAALRTAQPAWEALGVEARVAWMYRLRDWLLDNEERLLPLVQAESGKSWADTSLEVSVGIEVINYYAAHAAGFIAPDHPKPHAIAQATKRLELRYRPYPLVGLITPWNGPLGGVFLDLPPALLAGCAVLTKPSELASLTWAEVVRAWQEELGAPPVLECVTGDGETGAHVVDHVDMVQFTGSAATGRKVAARAAERLIPCSLELGGKDAMIVLEDADLDRAVGGAIWGGLHNSGQICISVERIYAVDAIHDAFVDKLTERVRGLRQGLDDPGAFASDIGSMSSARQLSIVAGHVDDAIARGARALTGGRPAGGPGHFYPPTVLVDVDHEMACMREETFGPTLPVMRVRDEDEAVRLANDSPYGLSASVWTRDLARAERLSWRLEVGAVNVNHVMINLFQFPLAMGGWKESGIGSRFGGASGIRKYCRAQAYVTDRVAPKSEIFWYPATPLKGQLMARIGRLFAAGDWRRRLGLGRK